MRFPKILPVIIAVLLFAAVSTRNSAAPSNTPNSQLKPLILSDGGAPLPRPPLMADGGAPLPRPPLAFDGGAPLPRPPLVADGGAPLPRPPAA
jgi:hypothetical protein